MNFFSWKAVPFVRFIVPLILGIILSVFVGTVWWLYVGLMIIGFAGLIITLNTYRVNARVILEKWSLFFISVLLIGLGSFLVDLNSTLDNEDHFSRSENSDYLKVELIESPQSKKKSTKTVLDVKQVLVDSVWLPAEGKLLVYLEKDSSASGLQIGDVLIIPSDYKSVSPPANPGEFNYKRFLSFRDIYQQQYVKTGHWRKIDEHWSLRRTSEQWRTYLRDRIDLIGMDEKEEAIASALLLGKKDELDPELIQSYASAGAMHVLAVSGLHVGIIFFILQFSLKWMDRWRNTALLKSIILIGCLWVYAFVTGLSPSVVRAATMFSAVTLATGLGRKSSIYNTVASSAFILLIFNPFYIMEVGFQLSYLAVLGIIYLHPKLYSLLYFPSWLPDKIWQISCVSIAAQLATFPLGLLYFHQFPSYFLLSNLIVIPAAFLILYVGLGYLLFSWIPFLGLWLGKLLLGLIWVLNKGVSMVEALPHSLVSGIDIGILATWAIYSIVILGTLAFVYRKKQMILVSLMVLSGLMIWQVYELFDLKRNPYIVVYDVRGDSVLNLISEKENLVHADEKWIDDKSKQQFHLRNNWNKHAAPEPFFFKDTTHIAIQNITDDIFLYEGHSFAVIDEKVNFDNAEKKVELDFLVLSYHRGLSLEKILTWADPQWVILDGTIRGKTIKRLKKEAAGLRIHAVNEDGYFAQRL